MRNIKKNIFKGFTYFLFICLMTSYLQAQETYHNEWIDYTKTYYQIQVVHPATYRINYDVLSQSIGTNIAANDIRLEYLGEQVPVYVSTNTALGDNDYIEFYGTPNDGTFDKLLYEEEEWQLNPYYNLFCDTAIYYLSLSNAGANLRYQNITNDLTGNLPAKEAFFWETSNRLIINQFSGGDPYRSLGASNNFFSNFQYAEGFVGERILETVEKVYKMPISEIYEAEPTAYIDTRVVGQSDDFDIIDDHHVTVKVNDQFFDEAIYEGREYTDINFELPSNILTPPLADVSFTSENDLADVDKNSVVYINLRYARHFNFSNKKKYVFSIENNGDKYIEIENFNGGNEAIVYDLTNNLRFVPSLENDVYRLFLPQVANGENIRKIAIVNTTSTCDFFCTPPACSITSCGLLTVSQMQATQFTDYSLPNNQGNYLIVTHPSLMEGEINEIERYKEYRESDVGGNYEVQVLDIEDLYHQYAYGIQKHPWAITKAITDAIDTWATPPEYLLILGKSISYNKTRFSIPEFSQCLVPTYGNQASDMQLVCRNDASFVPQIAVGRIPARTPNDVKNYLDKIIQHEAPVSCSFEDRTWRKNAIHIAGGKNIEEAELFLGYLNNYKAMFEDSIFAGDVVFTYTKADEDIVEFPDLDVLINEGVGIINFVGHGAGLYWDVDMGPPTDYQNTGKYPFIFSSSCYVGNIHENSNFISMAEDYILAEQLGAIGFIGTIGLGYPTFMNMYMSNFYEKFCKSSYNQPIGRHIKNVGHDWYEEDETNKSFRYAYQTFVLTADPAVVINSWDNPEYALKNDDVFFEPQQVTANIDSFAINTVVTNLGNAVSDSFNIQIIRTYPDGTSNIAALERFATPIYIDTFQVFIQTKNETTDITGDNFFEINIDYDNEIIEDCEDNNIAFANTFIFSDLLVPISPCNFSIICQENPTLSASTGQPLIGSLPYKIEMDTTALFTNPIAQTVLNSEAGVINWTPNISYQNNTVYYWRTSQVPPDDGAYNWQQSSFIYKIDDCEAGWNQSDYFQFTENNFTNIYVSETSELFEFDGTENILSVTNSTESYPDIETTLNFSFAISNQSCLKGDCNGGLAFVVLKPEEVLVPLTSELVQGTNCNGRGTYGNLQCGGGTKYGFEFYTGSVGQVDTMLMFMNNVVPSGYYVLVYSVFNHRIGTTDATEPIFDRMPEVYDFFESIGISEINDITPDNPFIAFGRKGSSSFEAEFYSPQTTEDTTFTAQIRVDGRKITGGYKTPPIGPSHAWSRLLWAANSLENSTDNNDYFNINVYGQTSNGTQNLLLNTDNATEVNLDIIDAETYPFLRLEVFNSDTTSFTPTQLQHWRVFYDMAGELALNKNHHFVFHSDTLQEGENIHLEYAVTNVTGVNMDSVSVNYSIVTANNEVLDIAYPLHAPVLGNQTVINTFDYSTEALVGDNLLIVELNPNDHQLEKFHFNNIMVLPFHVTTDKINPILDVTFDGQHILDGEIVSAKPMISIKVRDENPFLALNDTADVAISLVYPDEYGNPIEERQIYFSDTENLQFFPATQTEASKNEALVEFSPQLENDGTYQLLVRAKDRSDNNFTTQNAAYQISFKSFQKPMLSNVLNYPNPFTSTTQFVFTLTGSEIPQFFNIQIMTVSGKVVREITQAELGDLHIGQNITDFAWDGTDAFGNPLGNGLYLYRVVANLNGQKIEHFDNSSIDALFQNGVGKMYLMR